VQPAPLVPEFWLHLADQLVPLWQATEWRAASAQPPPFWAFAWPGSLALARYLLDNPAIVRGKRVLDAGAGSGLAAIAAARTGATRVVACDIDPVATLVQGMNADLNNVSFERLTSDVVTLDDDFEVILTGDLCYERLAADAIVTWLRTRRNAVVLLADPGRHYAPTDGLELLATYDVPTLKELESADTKRTRLWRLLAARG
jgi:predicted nicotinamide N-methyase